MRRLVDACEDPEQRRLAGAVVADQADPVAMTKRQGNIPKRLYTDPIAGVPSDAPAGSQVH
jgi:hypothetical protein